MDNKKLFTSIIRKKRKMGYIVKLLTRCKYLYQILHIYRYKDVLKRGLYYPKPDTKLKPTNTIAKSHDTMNTVWIGRHHRKKGLLKRLHIKKLKRP